MKKKKTIISIIISIIIILAIIFCINLYVKTSTDKQIIKENDYTKISDVDCIIILGAGIWGEKPSPMLEDRLQEGINLYQNGVANKIIMSGDHGRKEYDEVNIMKNYAIEKGIPSENIFMDHAGFSTYESIYRAKEIFQAKKVVIVTQKYHLYRALYIANKLGLDAYGVNSDPRKYVGDTYREIREILARDKDFIKCIFKPKPTYLGDTIPVSGNGDFTNDDKNATNLTKFNYEFNPHVISKEYLTVFGADIEKTFYDFCDAVLNGDNTFSCPSKEKLNYVYVISRVCMPIASEYVDKDKCYVTNGVGHIVYKIEKEELLKKVNEFKDKVTNVITSAIPYEEDDLILAMELLTAVSNKNVYDERYIEDPNELDYSLEVKPYRPIMTNIGICQELAGEYIYYLLQVGINATTCSGMDKPREYSHEWAVVELDGEHYHVDPTFALQYKDSLAFFCMDDEMREQYGNFDKEDFAFADSSIIKYKIDSKKYKDLWGAETYTIDRANRKINMTIFYSGKKKEYNY